MSCVPQKVIVSRPLFDAVQNILGREFGSPARPPGIAVSAGGVVDHIQDLVFDEDH